MIENRNFGIRELQFDATVARTLQKISVRGFGLAVIEAPSDAAGELHLGGENVDVLPLLAGVSLGPSPAPFQTLYLSNVAGASGNIRIIVLTEPGVPIRYSPQGSGGSSGTSIEAQRYDWHPDDGWLAKRRTYRETVLPAADRTTTTQVTIPTYGAALLFMYLEVTANPGGAQTLQMLLRHLWNGVDALNVAQNTATAYGGTAGFSAVVMGPGINGSTLVGGTNNILSTMPPGEDAALRIVHSGAGIWNYALYVDRIFY